MKKITLALIFIFVFGFSEAQRKKEFQFRSGYGFAGYRTLSKVDMRRNSSSSMLSIPLELRYEITERINLGVEVKAGLVWDYSDTSSAASSGIVQAGILSEYNFITKENFRWYGGIGLNYAILNFNGEKHHDLLGNYRDLYSYRGIGYGLNTGLLIFIKEHFGFNFNLGYTGYYFELKSARADHRAIYYTYSDRNFFFNGIGLGAGIVLRF